MKDPNTGENEHHKRRHTAEIQRTVQRSKTHRAKQRGGAASKETSKKQVTARNTL